MVQEQFSSNLHYVYAECDSCLRYHLKSINSSTESRPIGSFSMAQILALIEVDYRKVRVGIVGDARGLDDVEHIEECRVPLPKYSPAAAPTQNTPPGLS